MLWGENRPTPDLFGFRSAEERKKTDQNNWDEVASLMHRQRDRLHNVFPRLHPTTHWYLTCSQTFKNDNSTNCRSNILAALAALYLTLVTDWVSDCHFWILTQRVTFDAWDPSDIWSAICLDKGQKDKKTKRQKDKNTQRQKGEKTKREKDKRKGPKRESLILWRQGSFALLQCFYLSVFWTFVNITLCLDVGSFKTKEWRGIMNYINLTK